MNTVSSSLLFSLDMLISKLPPFGPQAKAACLAFGAVLLWATWPALATVASPAPPFMIFGLAAAVGFVVSCSLAAVQGKSAAFFSASPRTLIVVAIGLLTNNIFYLLAMPRVGPSEANVIAYLWPALLVVIMTRLRRQRLGSWRMVGITVAFAGAALAIGPGFERGFSPTGILFAFLSGLAFAVYAAIRSHGRESHDVIGPSMGLLAVVAIGFHVTFEAAVSLTYTQLLAIAGIGIAPLTLSNALWDRAVRTGYTAMISCIAYLTPLAALLILAVFGVGTVSIRVVVGAVLVVIGALAASGFLPLSRRQG